MVINPENQNHGEETDFSEEERRQMHEKLMANPNKKSLTTEELRKAIEIAKRAEKKKAKIEFPKRAKNYYEVLEVAKDAVPEQITEAFKRFNEAHYGKNKTTEEEREKYREEFRAKDEAYKILSRPEVRELYDIWLREQAEEKARLDKEQTDQKLADAFKREQDEQKKYEPDEEALAGKLHEEAELKGYGTDEEPEDRQEEGMKADDRAEEEAVAEAARKLAQARVEFEEAQQPQPPAETEEARVEDQVPPAPETPRPRKTWREKILSGGKALPGMAARGTWKGLWGIGRTGLATVGAIVGETAVRLWRGGVFFVKTMWNELGKLGGEFSELFQAAKDAYKKVSGREK